MEGKNDFNHVIKIGTDIVILTNSDELVYRICQLYKKVREPIELHEKPRIAFEVPKRPYKRGKRIITETKGGRGYSLGKTETVSKEAVEVVAKVVEDLYDVMKQPIDFSQIFQKVNVTNPQSRSVTNRALQVLKYHRRIEALEVRKPGRGRTGQRYAFIPAGTNLVLDKEAASIVEGAEAGVKRELKLRQESR